MISTTELYNANEATCLINKKYQKINKKLKKKKKKKKNSQQIDQSLQI